MRAGHRVQAGVGTNAQDIFNSALRVRQMVEQSADEGTMERTIPIFRGLIAAVNKQFHRNHAQLGYALKDMHLPTFRGVGRADDGNRDSRQRRIAGWRFYEFQPRHLTDHARPGVPGKATVKGTARSLIQTDLKFAVTHRDIVPLLNDEPIKSWLALNNVVPERSGSAGAAATATWEGEGAGNSIGRRYFYR